MRIFLTILFVFGASAASAHVGHFGNLAGHDHWVAAGALGVAGLVAVWGALKGKKPDEKTPQPEAEPSQDEAPA